MGVGIGCINRWNLFDGYRVIDMDIREQERHEEKDNHKELRIFEYKDIRSSTTGHKKGGRCVGILGQVVLVVVV